MKPIQEVRFDDLPLFHVPRHRQVWESLAPQTREEMTNLLTQLFLDHLKIRGAQPSQKGVQGHE
jgi:hypothetical protein